MLRRGGAGRAERAVSDGDVKMKGAKTMRNDEKRERQARPGANAADWMLERYREELNILYLALAEVEARLYELGVDVRTW